MPSARLTETLIKRKALPPGESQLVIYDQLAPGLALRIGKNTRTFFVKTRVLVAGKWQQKKIQIGRADEVSLENARSQANKIKRQARNGESVIGRSERIERLRQASIQTFATVRKDFLANHVGRANRRPADSTLAEMKRVLESNEVQLWNDLPIEQVTVDLIRTAVGEVRARGAQTMANRMLAYLRLLFGHAIDQQLIADNPATQVKKFGAEVRRSRVLTLDEIRQLWTVTGASARSTSLFFPIVRILLLTGQRLNEVQGMCWSEIEFDERIWRLPEERTKNNRPHLVPLSDLAIDLLCEIKATQAQTNIATEYVFTIGGEKPFGGESRGKRLLDQELSIAPWRTHDLRRTFATQMAEQLGVSAEIIELILNHVSGAKAGVAGTYNRALHLQRRRQALDSWASLVNQVASSTAKNCNVVQI